MRWRSMEAISPRRPELSPELLAAGLGGGGAGGAEAVEACAGERLRTHRADAAGARAGGVRLTAPVLSYN